ncbi:MAG: tetratricopeptide repeat protein [Phormidesmis sp. CAN_BIN44]|nr:tetratricopeptide repeat protein [Phormidesmis sp. CAN_BIN44]
MATPARSSWKHKRDQLIRLDFIGRQEQLTAFRASVTDIEARTVIFAISGQGGVGKTTLLKEFRRITQECKHIAAYVDEGSATNRVEDVSEALYRLAKDFETQNSNYKFEKFQERYKTYRQKRQELEADPDAPSGIASGIGRAGAKLVLGSVKAIPGMGEMMGEFVDSDAVAEKGGDLLSFAWKKFRNQDEVQLVTEPLEVLTPLFLEEMNRIAERQRVVLLLDTYEVTGKFLDDWLRAVLDCRYGDDLTDNFRLCIAGRDPLDRNAWAQLEPCIARSPLEPFTENEARRFLIAKSVTSEAVIGQIRKLSSGGLPLLVSMMAQNAPTSVNAVVDPCEDAVERFLKWEVDEAKKQLAQDGSVPRVLNEDVVGVLGDGQFEWLKGCAFVLRDGERWRYHSVVREQMLRYQLQKSRKRWAEVHGKLAAYYEEVRLGLGMEIGKESKDKMWRELSLEWLYHELCAVQQARLGMALNGFLTALKASRVFAREWAKVMVQAGQEAKCETVQRWGERLRDGMVAHQEKLYEQAIPSLTALLSEPVIEEKLKAVALGWRGRCYLLSKQEELALKDLQQVIEIDGEDAKYWFDLALTYQTLKRYDEAITAYRRAIEIDPKSAIYHYTLGDVYREQKRYEEALKDFDRTIELDPESAWLLANRGQTYQALERYEEALKDFDLALSIDPIYPQTREKLGYLQYQLGDYNASLCSFQKALDLQPDNSDFSSSLGYLHLLQGHFDKAQELIEVAFNNKPFDRAWLNLGLIQVQQGKVEEAKQSWQQGLSLMEDDSDWEKSVRYVFTVALGNSTTGLKQMQHLIDHGADKVALRNALNDATILSRGQIPLEGIEQMLELLRKALS